MTEDRSFGGEVTGLVWNLVSGDVGPEKIQGKRVHSTFNDPYPYSKVLGLLFTPLPVDALPGVVSGVLLSSTGEKRGHWS